MARPSHRPGNLPADSTTFVGRHRELGELKKTLADARLVTLVGPGGVGKTRLAIRLASEIHRSFRHGAWLVELAELNEPALVANAVLSALDLRDQTAAEPLNLLLSYVGDKELLLVIDNCEHLVASCGSMVTQILAKAPHVKVVATSREPLSIQGEYVELVPPLELPAEDPPEALSKALENEAIKLFVERATAASGRFDLSHANLKSIAELCRRLDGLPLAIELAAVRTRVLSVAQILDRLSDRFGLLTTGSRAALPRHKTLTTTIDWSYDLLDTRERALLRQIGVFAGSFGLEAIESICQSTLPGNADMLSTLSSLVDKSLVVKKEQEGSARYRLHESMREYALVKLRDAKEDDGAYQRHTDYYTSFGQISVEEAPSRLVEWLAWVDAEIDNIRAVLQRCFQAGDHALGVAMATRLGWYWAIRATTEGVRWLDQFLTQAEGQSGVLAHAHFFRGYLAMTQGEVDAAVSAFEKAAAVARAAGEFRLLALTDSTASFAHNLAGDHARATQLLHDVGSMVEALDDESVGATVTYARGFNSLVDGDLETAKSMYRKAAEMYRAQGLLFGLEQCLMNLGAACFLGGDVEESKPIFVEGLSIAGLLDDRPGQFHLLTALGCQAAAAGQPKLAGRLLGAGEKIRREIDASLNVFFAVGSEQAKEAAISTLGVEGFEAEFSRGMRLGREEAIALALGKPPQSPTADSGAVHDALLGKREAQVARLVAAGLSNKQIGGRLFISDRTVESHVSSIMNKLGFNSRAQIAGWVASWTAGAGTAGELANR